MQFAPLKIEKHLRTITPLTLVVMALLLLTACGNSSPEAASTANNTKTPAGTRPPQTAYPMPPTTATSTHSRAMTDANSFTLVDNRRMKLSDYAGQVVVLDFYATWCPPCREETPHLVQLQKRYGPQGLFVIGLNVGGPDDRDKIPEFVREYGIQYTLGFPDAEMTQLYLSDDDRIPQSFVFDRQGRLIKRFISYDETVPAELERVIKEALAAK